MPQNSIEFSPSKFRKNTAKAFRDSGLKGKLPLIIGEKHDIVLKTNGALKKGAVGFYKTLKINLKFNWP